MRFKWKGQCYELSMKKKIIPQCFRPIVRDFFCTPENSPLAGSDKLKGKVALITGGYKGIGLAIAKTFLREGAYVIITGRDGKSLKNVCDKVNNSRLAYLVWDVAKMDLCEDNFVKAAKIFGSIDILVNNAGVTTDGKNRVPFAQLTENHFEYVNDINTIGTVCMCKQFVKRGSRGVIVNIISNTGVRPAQDAYFLSKWALYSFTKAFAEAMVRKGTGIMVNGICPGPVKTEMSYTEKSSITRLEIPNGRMALPEELAELTLMTVCGAMTGMTGNVIICDGGETLN